MLAMKRFLGLFLSLVSLNLAGSLSFYQKAKVEDASQKDEVLNSLKYNNAADLNNVAIVELLLKKFPDVNYASLTSRSMADKKADLTARLTPPLPKPAGPAVAAPLPKPTVPTPAPSVPTPAPSVKSTKAGLVLSNPNDINNLVAVEYKLVNNFGRRYKELIGKSFKIKQQELQSLLSPKPATPAAGGAGAPQPTISPASTTISTMAGQNAQALIDAGVISDLSQITSGLSDDSLEKYAKMLRLGQPAGAVIGKMLLDGAIVSKPKATAASKPAASASKPEVSVAPAASPVAPKPKMSLLEEMKQRQAEIRRAKGEPEPKPESTPSNATPPPSQALPPVQLPSATPAPNAGAGAPQPQSAPKPASFLEQINAGTKLKKTGIATTTTTTASQAAAPKPATPTTSSALSSSSTVSSSSTGGTASPTTISADLSTYGPNVQFLIAAKVQFTPDELKNLSEVDAGKYTTFARLGVDPAQIKTRMQAENAFAPKSAAPKPASSEVMGGAGGPVSSVTPAEITSGGSTVTGVDPKVQKYVDMVKRRATNEEILAALIAPKPVNKENLVAVIPEDSTQDINDMNVLDYLLKTKYSQPQATLDKMYPYFKIFDIKRHLLPDEFKNEITMKIPYANSQEEANFPNTARPRNQKFYREWIEFPSPTMDRHLDYSNVHTINGVYLLDSNSWEKGKIANDYVPLGNPYNDVANYYWNPNGETFTLVYKDGTYRSYKGIDGTPVTEFVKLPEEEEIVIESDTDEPAEEDEAAPASAVVSAEVRTQAIKEKQAQETEPHFAARQRAKLNSLGKFGISNEPTTVLAMAIWGLDTTFRGLEDSDIAILRDYDKSSANINEINNLLDRDPLGASLLDQAKVYIAIHSGWVDQTDPRVARWDAALDAIEAKSTGLTGIGSKAKVKLIENIKLNNDIFVQTVAKYTGLTPEQNSILQKPGKYLRSLDLLLKEDPKVADDFTKAKINLVLRSQWIDEDAPENKDNLTNINKWKSALDLV